MFLYQAEQTKITVTENPQKYKKNPPEFFFTSPEYEPGLKVRFTDPNIPAWLELVAQLFVHVEFLQRYREGGGSSNVATANITGSTHHHIK